MATIPSSRTAPWWSCTEISRASAQGFCYGTDWFETGFYSFTSEHNRQGVDWVGDHIGPRFRATTTPVFSGHRRAPIGKVKSNFGEE